MAFARYLVDQPPAAAFLLYDGRAAVKDFTAGGATKGNAQWEQGVGDLNIESQRNAYLVLAAGIASTETDKAMLLDRGIRALEWGFNQQGPDGSFPAERAGAPEKSHSIHAKSEFLESAAWSLLLLSQSGDIDPSFRDRATALSAKLDLSAEWLARSDDLTTFFMDGKNSNQLFFIAAALQEAGLVTGKAALGEKAISLVMKILSSQTADGVFPEAGGFDLSYQTVSVDLLTRIASTVMGATLRATLLEADQRAIDRFLRQVAPDGTIDTSGNTRTAACGAPIPGLGPKGKDVDVIPLRLYQFGYLTGAVCTLAAVADSIEAVGQGFDHIGTCADGGT
jgi:hypothetical protein